MNDDKKKPEFKFDLTPEEIRAQIEKLKAEFSLEDLKAFDVEEKDIVPFPTVLDELEALMRQQRRKDA